MRILERLDELNLGIRGQTMGMDMDCPLAVSLAVTNQVAILMDALWALSNML